VNGHGVRPRDVMAPDVMAEGGAPRPSRPARPSRAAAPRATPAGVPLRRPTHPGRFLERQFLRPLALTQVEAARRLGISRRRLNELVQGHRGMTPDTAIRCALIFGWPVDAWLALQAGWDSHQAWRQARGTPRARRDDEAVSACPACPASPASPAAGAFAPRPRAA